MIPQDYITEWRAQAPWVQDAQVEQDLVICRAGALTIAELAAAGVASILVPFPAAVDDHQTANAHWMADAGAAPSRASPARENGQFLCFLSIRYIIFQMYSLFSSQARPL